ncbi:MAG TPA: hypothetical protein VFV99_16035 [Kofleriaceae bacterium]|nr:hypothetical protein [Kofleriaceae bacterium]
MGVKKFRDISEIEDVVYERGSRKLYEVIRYVWGLSDVICPQRFPSGVFKHRTIEDAEALREQWEEANFRAHRARMARQRGDKSGT